MMRWAYWLLLQLHPARFRQEYAGEMLWIFDETCTSKESVGSLFLDGALSLARQWVVRSGSWKVPVAILGGFLQVTLGGLGWLAMETPRIAAQTAKSQFQGERVGEFRDARGLRSLQLQLTPAGSGWAGKVLLDCRESAISELRVELGSLHFNLAVGEASLRFEGKRAVRGGQVFGVVNGFEQGTFHLRHE